MKLHWQTNKVYPIPDRTWLNKEKTTVQWWELFVISKKHNFSGFVYFEEEYKDENGDILAEACVTNIDGDFKIFWSDVDHWISKADIQNFLEFSLTTHGC
jgi:hypothetical protein